jgi:hypothetical protein
MIDPHGEPVRENYRRQGEVRERERIIALIERRICFDALADDDGRCPHHGGKCYAPMITLQRGDSSAEA